MWIYIEDRDLETGHGWRDLPKEQVEVKEDRVIVDGVDIYKSASCSYAWICPGGFFDKNGYLKDNVRAPHLLRVFPEFNGGDDMESHFEFDMTPEEMIAHLEGLGIERRIKKG